MPFFDLSPNIVQSIIEGDSALIDVRSKEEFDAVHAKHAINFDLVAIESGKLPDIHKSIPIYVYCRTGRRSEAAKILLMNFGYTKVENIGGLSEVSPLL